VSEPPLFREEAVRDWMQVRTRGQLLRISPRWTSWVFWVLLATVAGAAAFVSIVRTDRWARGPAVVRATEGGGLEVVALMPATERPRLEAGQTLLARLAGDAAAPRVLRVESVAAEIVGPRAAGERLGGIADLVPVAGPVVLVRATLPDPSPSLVPGVAGVADVRVGRGTLLSELLPGVRP